MDKPSKKDFIKAVKLLTEFLGMFMVALISGILLLLIMEYVKERYFTGDACVRCWLEVCDVGRVNYGP